VNTPFDVFVRFRQAEVEKIHSILIGATWEAHHEIVWLNIAMNITRVMHTFNPLELLSHEIKG
jgi:hypothetical protein